MLTLEQGLLCLIGLLLSAAVIVSVHRAELLPLIRSWFVKDFPEGFRDAVAAKGFL